MKLLKCRYPAGRGGIAARYFDEYLGREASRDMEQSAQRRGDREGENAGLRFARQHERNLELLCEELTAPERKIAERAVKCYRAGGMVLWDRR